MKPQSPLQGKSIAAIAEALSDCPVRTISPSGAAVRAAVAVVLRQAECDGPEALFIRRAEHPLDPWSGHIAFPGGRMETDDESPEAAARRETFEEVGLPLTREMLIGRLDEVSSKVVREKQYVVSPYVYQCDGDSPFCLSSEVDSAFWLPLASLSSPADLSPYRLKVGCDQLVFPSFLHGPHRIWGMTYDMIRDFMRRLGVELPGVEMD